MNDMILEIRHLSKSFGTHEVLRRRDQHHRGLRFR